METYKLHNVRINFFSFNPTSDNLNVLPKFKEYIS